MKTLQEKYTAVAEGRFDKVNFVRDAKNTFPDFISPANTFEDVVKILRNKGILTESKKPETPKMNYTAEMFLPEDNYSLYEIDLGIRVELEEGGLLPGQRPTEEQYNKARATALKNLKKNRNYYTSPENQTKRTDLPAQVTKSETSLVDTANGMKKLNLKESFTSLIKKIIEDK